jgi:histidinol-phosphate aminotransferase
VAGATSVEVPVDAEGRHDLAAMASAVTDRTRVVIVCSPNNPTSTVVTATEFAAFMAAVPETALVVLDEAYAEFVTDPDAVDGSALIGRYPNLVLLRTFSKAYGLAGLRVGYAVGAEYLMDAARATAIPLSVTEAAQRAALAALDHEHELLDRVHRLTELRDRIHTGLAAQGWTSPRPQGNFVWLPTGEHTQAAADILIEHGIVSRPLGDGVRVSVGEAESVETLLRSTARVVGIL